MYPTVFVKHITFCITKQRILFFICIKYFIPVWPCIKVCMFHRDFVAHVSKYICNKSCIENAPECRVLDNFIGTIDKCGSICTLVNVGKQTSYSVRVLIYLTTSELCILKMIGQYLDSSLLSYLNKIKLQRKLQNIM